MTKKFCFAQQKIARTNTHVVSQSVRLSVRPNSCGCHIGILWGILGKKRNAFDFYFQLFSSSIPRKIKMLPRRRPTTDHPWPIRPWSFTPALEWNSIVDDWSSKEQTSATYHPTKTRPAHTVTSSSTFSLSAFVARFLHRRIYLIALLLFN